MLIRQSLFSAAIGAAFLISSSAQAGYVGWPCSGTVTSPYGPRSSPCSGCSTYHHGIDIGVGTGTDLGAPTAGTVSSYVYDSCGGNIFKINFGGGWESRFLHCSARIASVGQAVSRNQHVAESGGTGSCTTGPHLHFEMRKDGVSQSIPGSSGTWVTRNANVPKDFVGVGTSTGAHTAIIDNGSAGFSVVGTWATGSSSADKYGADYRYKSTNASSEPASFTATNLPSGTYNIAAWWAAGTNRSASAPYILPNNVSVPVNQQINGGRWNSLGNVALSGTATTKLSIWATSGFIVVADAVKYQK